MHSRKRKTFSIGYGNSGRNKWKNIFFLKENTELLAGKAFLEGKAFLICEKTARRNTAKSLLDKIAENAPMGTILHQQGGTPRMM